MNFLYGDCWNFDLEKPIKMTEEQRDALRKELLALGFVEVEFRDTEKRRTKRVGAQARWPRDWSPKELAQVLMLEKSDDEIGLTLARSGLAVIMICKKWLPELYKYAEDHDKVLFSLSSEEHVKLITQMMDEKLQKKAKIKSLNDECNENESKLESMEKNKNKIFAYFDAKKQSGEKKKYLDEMLKLAKRIEEINAELDCDLYGK